MTDDDGNGLVGRLEQFETDVGEIESLACVLVTEDGEVTRITHVDKSVDDIAIAAHLVELGEHLKRMHFEELRSYDPDQSDEFDGGRGVQ